MGAIELNAGLARAAAKPGEIRNPLGIGNQRMGARSRVISEMYRVELNQLCTIEGYEGWTQLQFLVHVAVLQAMSGDKIARKHVLDRAFGRVPLELSMDVTHRDELAALSDSELLARVDALRQQILDVPATEAK